MNGKALANALDLPPATGAESNAAQQLKRQTEIALTVTAAIIAAWIALAPLSGAVVANGFVKTELNRKTIQHQEGGIVREILVREGQQVKAGQPLVAIGDPRMNATLGMQQDQMTMELIRKARLEAELRMSAAFHCSAELAARPGSADYLERERVLFNARRKSLNEQIASLSEQIRETEAQIKSLEVQVGATDRGTRTAREELEINEKLVQQGYIQRTRILALERTLSNYEGSAGEYRGNLAAARQRIGDYRLRIAQARNQYLQQAADELKDNLARIKETEERLKPAEDMVERQLVRSPVDGEVMSLRIGATGTAVGPREPILDVVPAKEKLVVEARVKPTDIDYVRVGGSASVRLTAFEYRRTPVLDGQVMSVSADRVEDARSDTSWFVATIEVDAAKLGETPGVRMQPGMPAEVYVATPARSFLEYMLNPLSSFAARAMREP